MKTISADRVLIPEEVSDGEKKSYQTTSTGNICQIKFTVDRSLYQV
jgi:hypothetical protein